MMILLVRQCYFDNQIDTEECIMIHENDRSFALAKGSPKPGTWAMI